MSACEGLHTSCRVQQQKQANKACVQALTSSVTILLTSATCTPCDVSLTGRYQQQCQERLLGVLLWHGRARTCGTAAPKPATAMARPSWNSWNAHRFCAARGCAATSRCAVRSSAPGTPPQ